jgi:hypothetical protein
MPSEVFISIEPFETIFRDKLKNILFEVASEVATGFTRDRSVRVWILGVAGSLQPKTLQRPPTRR